MPIPLSNMPPDPLAKTSAQAEFQKYADAMKEFMSANVASLAAGSGSQDTPQVITVRGKKIVLPKRGTARAISIIGACLYAAENPGIDRVFHDTNTLVEVLNEDGSISVVPMIEDEAHVSKPVEEPTRGRTLLLEESPVLLEEPKATQFVVVKDSSGNPTAIGVVVGQGTPVGDDVRIRAILTITGERIEVSDSRIFGIADMADLAIYSTQIVAARGKR